MMGPYDSEALSKQHTNVLIKLCTLKMFRPVKIKLKVVTSVELVNKNLILKKIKLKVANNRSIKDRAC